MPDQDKRNHTPYGNGLCVDMASEVKGPTLPDLGLPNRQLRSVTMTRRKCNAQAVVWITTIVSYNDPETQPHAIMRAVCRIWEIDAN